jgi:hypothetical protein
LAEVNELLTGARDFFTEGGREATAERFDVPLPCPAAGSRLANHPALWETVGMTNQQTNKQQRPQHREDHKVQKLVERIEMKLAVQAKAVREASQASSNN